MVKAASNAVVVTSLTGWQLRRALFARRKHQERLKMKRFKFDPITMKRGRNLCLLGPPIGIEASYQRYGKFNLLTEADGLVCCFKHIDPTSSVRSDSGEVVGYRQMEATTTIDAYGEVCGDDGNYYQGFEIQGILRGADMPFSIVQVRNILINHIDYKMVLNLKGGPNVFSVYNRGKVWMLIARFDDKGKLWRLTDSTIGQGRGLDKGAHFIVKNKWLVDAIVGEKK